MKNVPLTTKDGGGGGQKAGERRPWLGALWSKAPESHRFWSFKSLFRAIPAILDI